jgi:hypothetical protein
VDKTVTLKQLKLAAPALGQSNLIKGLDCFHFDNDVVSAFNGSLAVITKLPEPFPVNGWINGDTFVKVLGEMPEPIAVSVDSKDNSLTVRSLSSKVVFPVAAVENELFVAPEAESDDIKLPISGVFLNGIERCLASLGKAIGVSEVGVSLFINAGRCEMYSSNGVTYSRYAFDLTEEDKGAARTATVFLPAAFCENLSYLFGELLTCPDEIAISRSHIRALFPTVSLYSSFYASPVKSGVKSIFNSTFAETKLVPVPKGLVDAIRRVDVINATTSSSDTQMHYGPKLVLTASGIGDIVETLDLDYPSEGVLITDVRNLQKVLDHSASIGFGKDCVALLGSDPYFSHIISAKAP